jgi:hypothetical protein
MPECLKRRSVKAVFGPSPVSNDGTHIIYQGYPSIGGSAEPPPRTPVATRQAVLSVRDRIDAIITVQQRREILRALGCFEQDLDSVPKLRRAKNPTTTGGVELLAAIDALDLACLQGSDEEVEATGSRLIELWEMFR